MRWPKSAAALFAGNLQGLGHIAISAKWSSAVGTSDLTSTAVCSENARGQGESPDGSTQPQEFWAKQYGQAVSPYELQEIRTNLLGLVNFLIENGTSKQG